jgi:ATP-dependent helicase HrpB
MVDLPVTAILPELAAALAGRGIAVLQAPPGAGKTTVVPLDLLERGVVEGRILMLEPRRLAARAAAERMAGVLGEAVGARGGYRIRGEAKVGPMTRVEVVTEGILTRMIRSDPELSGVGLVIFDEFHERSLNADLGLALALELRAALRATGRLELHDGSVLLVVRGACVGGVLAPRGGAGRAGDDAVVEAEEDLR